ncbi:LADA_0H15214g1_1 [Lachancea dasiensis]|uniref:LADA_0H15214g1_1 n=1 Tax=Lachancea dasiensis TaxID=1072105 RepID=A0A1G4K4Q7_9SACH|nr:LADA_0H15214g1_1 [Lachancea dasiensis]
MSERHKRNRNRVPLSCTICRKRKVKCDKKRPHCDQCVKTGVAHLCHYMEQTWAEEAEKELSKDSELKQLRERIKALEKMLSVMHAASSTTPESTTAMLEEKPYYRDHPQASSQEPKLLDERRFDNDELDLTRQFDMLHLKNNGTVHLGATHWLAIMKGDPYLKLLWGHIFTMREKMSEWIMNKRRGNANNGSGRHLQNSAGKCPVIHQVASSGCPVSSMAHLGTLQDKTTQSKCPVDHQTLLGAHSTNEKTENSRPNVTTPLSSSQVSKEPSPRCPIAHSQKSTTYESNRPVAHETPGTVQNNTGIQSHPVTLPSFEKLTSKCPVIHDSSPPPPTGLGPNPSNKTQDQAIAELCKLLPPKRIIALILDKFFKHVYPVIPILDEQSFKHQVNQIVQAKGDIPVLQLGKPSDCSTLGILIIILRLTWLSLPQNACSVDLGTRCGSFFVPKVTTTTVAQSREEQFLMNYETPAEAIQLVRKYLIRLDEVTSFSNSNVNLTTVQFAIFYKLYLMCCTEKTIDTQLNAFTSTSQDNEAHQMLLSSIVQMAFSCGLHRDPDNFPQLTVNTKGKLNKEAISSAERFKHTWRKTWYVIVSLDVQQSLSLGSPRLLRNLRDFSDTKLPYTSKIDYVRDIKELVVVKNYTLFFQIDICIAAVLNHILNVSMAKTVRKFELDSLIEVLKNICFVDGNVSEAIKMLVNKGLLFTTEGSVDQSLEEFYPLPSLEEVLSPLPSENEKDRKPYLPHEMTTRALFFSKHLMLRMLLYLLNYVLFTYYEPKGDIDPGTRPLAKGYAQEALNYAMDGFRNCFLLFNNSKVSESGNGSIFNHMEVVLAPYCLDVGHRALQFMVCLILRAKCGPLTGMNENPIMNSGNNTSSSEDENEMTSLSISRKELNAELADFEKDIDLDVGDELAEILLSRMTMFHKLTKQISLKYFYARRMMKSTGFFITLLKIPSNRSSSGEKDHKTSGTVSPKFNHPSIAKMTGFFKNVPSLIMSANGDQIKRCPVYQDAVGFLPTAGQGGFEQRTSSEGSAQHLTPLHRAYQPITYTSNDLRRTSDVRNSDTKRQKLGTEASRPSISFDALVKCESWAQSPPAPHEVRSSAPPFSSPIPRPDELPPSRGLKNSMRILQKDEAKSSAPLTNISPGAVSENSSSADYAPDFEDFLMQNSNLNGLMINASSIVEAVGFDTYNNQNTGSVGMTADFLPIDNSEIDGLCDLQSTNQGFPVWE